MKKYLILTPIWLGLSVPKITQAQTSTFELRMKDLIRAITPIPLKNYNRTSTTDGGAEFISYSGQNDVWVVSCFGSPTGENIVFYRSPRGTIPLSKAKPVDVAKAREEIRSLVKKCGIPFPSATLQNMLGNSEVISPGRFRFSEFNGGVTAKYWGNRIQVTFGSDGSISNFEAAWNRKYLPATKRLPDAKLREIAAKELGAKLSTGEWRWIPVGTHERVKTLRLAYVGKTGGAIPDQVILDVGTGKVISKSMIKR
jgi:hypothetical protein